MPDTCGERILTRFLFFSSIAPRARLPILIVDTAIRQISGSIYSGCLDIDVPSKPTSYSHRIH